MVHLHRHSAGLIVIAVAVLMVSVGPVARVSAGAGSLDPQFGSGGKVITTVGAVAGVQALAVQRDGRIIAAGVSMARGIFFAEDFALVRYHPDGSVDSSFGHDGRVTTDFFDDQDHINAIGLQKDGKIVAAGRARKGADIYFGIARYRTDGTLDPEFGSGGKVVTSFFGYGDDARAMAIQPDGKIVVAGLAFSAPPHTGDYPPDANFGLARYNSDGNLDPTFGIGGKVSTNFGGYDVITAIAIQADGKIVAAGNTNPGSTASDFALARYNGDGSLDPSFGSRGKVITDFAGQEDFVGALALQPDGKIVLAGDVTTLSSASRDEDGVGLARYNKDGSLDASFGIDGKVITEGDMLTADAIVVQPNGRIVVTGLAADGTNGNFGLARYNVDGKLDSSFGSAGIITTDFAGPDQAFAIALQPDGKLIAGGYSYEQNTGIRYFALARYDVGDVNARSYDIHLESDTNRLEFDSGTGEYRFTDCASEVILTGVGRIKRRGCKIILRDAGEGYDVWAKVNICAGTGQTSIQLFAQNITYNLLDRDITSGSSSCP